MQRSVWALGALGLFFWPTRGAAAPSVVVFGGSARSGETVRVSLKLTSDQPIQGFRLALRLNPLEARVLDVSVSGTAAGAAERAVLKVLPDGASLDVLLDSDPPFAGQTISPGADREIGFLRVRAVGASGDAPLVSPITFTDQAGGQPFLPAVRIGGREVGPADGLLLQDGYLSIFGTSDDILALPDLTFDCVDPTPLAVPVLLTNASGPVEAFSLSVEHDPLVLELVGITLEGTVTALKGPEFVDVDLYPTGGTIGVVLDILPPFEGQTIALGNGRPIASYLYQPLDFDSPDRPTVATQLHFVDGLFGDPALSNLLVVEGSTRRPITSDGMVTLFPCQIGPVQFCVGAPGPGDTVISPIGSRGQDCLRVGLFYRSPYFLQGLQMAISYDDCLTGVEGSLELEDPGSLLAIVDLFNERQIDFFTYHFDNTSTDGDGRELVLGLLVEALPPFEDKRLRESNVPLLFAQMCFQVCDTVAAPVVLPMEFREGLNGRGQVRIFNRAVVDNVAVRPEFCQKPVLVLDLPPPPLPPGPEFVRGDCNRSFKVDVSDAAAVVAIFGLRYPPPGAVSLPFRFDPPCEDACDANDDGRVDFADAVAILRYLFKEQEPLPGPGPLKKGRDPTEDKLTCDLGS